MMKHIYYKNDFAVEITLLNASGEVVAPPDWEWHIEFTDGRRKYICSVERGNAKVVGNTIMCYLDNHKFCCGEVGYKFVQAIPDLNYLDGFQNLVTPKALPIELWEQESDNDVNIQSSVVPAYVVYDAYLTAKANGYTGTAEDFYGALASVVGIADAEKKRVTAEITRNANEQERIENEENRLNAESGRVNAEAQRVRNEAIRGEGENMRIEQEEDRKAKFEEITEFIATVRANEGNRESNERERQTNEDTRITEEAKRVEAEKKRATEFEQQKLDLTGKVDRSGDEMGGDLTFTDNAGVSFGTSDGGAHTIFNDTDDVAKFTADNGDTFEFTQDETPNKNSSAVVVSANLYSALDMTLDSMGSALDGDAAYRVEAGDKIFNPDTCKIQRYNSTIGGFEDLCDPIEGKLYANKMTGYIYRWDTKTKKMVFVGGVKAYTKDEADSRFAKLDDATQRVKVKELNADNFVSTKSMWIGDEGLLLGGDGNGHLTVEQDEVITDVTLNEKLKGKADDVAIGVEWENGQPSGQLKEMTVKEATSLNAATALIAGFSYNSLSGEVEKKADKTELNNYATKEYVQTNAPQETKESIEEKLGAWLEDDGGEADGEVYTKAESDARFLRGEVIYEDYYYPNMGKTTDNVNFTDSTEILQPTKFLESYTDENGVSWNDVFECASFPDWFDFAEKSCYPYGNGNSVGYLFIHNFVVENNELSYDFYTLQNNNIGQKLPYYANRNGLGLKKIDDTHFKVYNMKEGTTEFTAMNKAQVDCSLFAFSPLTYYPIYDIDDCNIVRITLTGNIQSPSMYSSLLNSSCDVGLIGYTNRQVLYGDEYVEIEIDKNNNRWRQIKNGYSMFYRSNYSQNWSANKPESYESECHCLWSKIPSHQQEKICMINKKICYAFSNKANPATILQMGCKIKIEKLA